MNNTLANGLQLLATLATTAEAHSVTELAQRLELPKSHVHRLLQTLVESGYAIQDADRRYRIGMEPLAISKALLANHPLRQLARPHLHRLAEATGMDAIVSIPHRNGGALVLAGVYPNGEQRDLATAIGNRLGFPGTATGALFAVTIPEHADATRLPAAERRAIARDDIALKDPTLAAPVNGIAIAVRDAEGTVMGALGLSAPINTFTVAVDAARPLLRAAATAINAALAHAPTA